MCHWRFSLMQQRLRPGRGGLSGVGMLDDTVVDLSFFSDFVDGIRRIWVHGSTRMSPGRHATMTCGSTIYSGLIHQLTEPLYRWCLFYLGMV